MKFTVSVSGQSESNNQSVTCSAEIQVDSLDQPTIQRLAQVASQCEAIACGNHHQVNGVTASRAAYGNPVQDASSGNNTRLATEKQIKAIKAMAGRKQFDLASALSERFGVSALSALSIGQASGLIDELKGNAAPS